MKKSEPLGRQISNMRLKHNMTQQALADACGVSLFAIRAIEQLQREPGRPLINAICQALGCEYIQELRPLKKLRKTIKNTKPVDLNK